MLVSNAVHSLIIDVQFKLIIPSALDFQIPFQSFTDSTDTNSFSSS